MQTKCDASLDFFISDANAHWQRCKCNFFIYDANVPCRDKKCKVYPWWCQRTYLIVMHMSPCRDGDAKILWCKCPLMGMSWCKYARHDANAPLWVCHGCKFLLESMPWYECLLGSMPWCECPLVCMQWTQMHPYGYIMTQMLSNRDVITIFMM